MKKTVEIEICDICGKEAKTRRMIVPTYRTFDANDGRTFYSEKQFHNEELDFCKECLEKITKVHSIGVMCDEYEIEKE
ncbi:MAG: hypothetical protein HFJ50_06465 [Clostridia bacterium]|jgi:hypothetical protein|nr:hypothetical protein [Clostridia bacterium]